MASRLSQASFIDTAQLEPYFNRLDVFVAFTDNGAYDLYGGIDENKRPVSVFAYPVNDVFGRKSKESSIYGRVFRFALKENEELDVFQYTNEKFDRDANELKKQFPNIEDFIDKEVALIPGKINVDNPFNRIWMLTFLVGLKLSEGKNTREAWASMFKALGYSAIFDNAGTGVIDTDSQNAVLLVFDQEQIEDLEILEIQKNKKEINQRIARSIARFNDKTAVSNARNRIKK